MLNRCNRLVPNRTAGNTKQSNTGRDTDAAHIPNDAIRDDMDAHLRAYVLPHVHHADPGSGADWDEDSGVDLDADSGAGLDADSGAGSDVDSGAGLDLDAGSVWAMDADSVWAMDADLVWAMDADLVSAMDADLVSATDVGSVSAMGGDSAPAMDVRRLDDHRPGVRHRHHLSVEQAVPPCVGNVNNRTAGSWIGY